MNDMWTCRGRERERSMSMWAWTRQSFPSHAEAACATRRPQGKANLKLTFATKGETCSCCWRCWGRCQDVLFKIESLFQPCWTRDSKTEEKITCVSYTTSIKLKTIFYKTYKGYFISATLVIIITFLEQKNDSGLALCSLPWLNSCLACYDDTWSESALDLNYRKHPVDDQVKF